VHHSDLSNLGSFVVSDGGSELSASEFVIFERERRRRQISETDSTSAQVDGVSSKNLPSDKIRPRGQYGLDDF
jgi:hypothetical protein